MEVEIDYRKIFETLPDIMSMPMERRLGKWYASRYMDGSYSPRQDKLVCRLVENGIQVLEQGGKAVTLFNWMIEYGGYTSKKDVYRALLNRSAAKIVVPEYIERKDKGQYVTEEEVNNSCGQRMLRPENLTRYLRGIFGTGEAEYILTKYRVGRTLRTIRGVNEKVALTQFWYINESQQVCHDKDILYLPNGHRDKRCSANRFFRKHKGYTNRCLFGEHLLLKRIDGERVFVVESEKTAIMCALHFGQGIWLACGGKSYLRKGDIAEDWTVIADYDAWEAWNNICPNQCPKWWESYPDYQIQSTNDIGDLIEWMHKKEGCKQAKSDGTETSGEQSQCPSGAPTTKEET